MSIADHRAARLRPPGAAPDQLRHACALTDVPFATTADATDQPAFAQPRALEALALAASTPSNRYNVFATGPVGTGRRAMIADRLRESAGTHPTPPDLVALYNFGDQLRPHAVPLPAGTARRFAEDVGQLVDDLRRGLSRAFESDGYRARHRELHEDVGRRQADVVESLQQRAAKLGVALQLTPTGALSVPMAGGRPLQADEIRDMPDAARRRYEAAVDELETPVDETFAALHDLDRELHERHRDMNREVAAFAIGHLVRDVQRRWAASQRVVAWLDALRDDVVEHLDVFRDEPDDDEPPARDAGSPLVPNLRGGGALADRYAINVLVSRDADTGAPVLVASDPSYYDLFGRVEYETAFGAAVTDHRHLRAGLMHQAAGGFLVLQAEELLAKPMVWPRLKDVLRTGRLKIENYGVQYMLFPGVTLDPEPADVDVTVVLVGSTSLYQIMLELDDDLTRLFKLRADFDDEMPRDGRGVRAYAGMLGAAMREQGLPDLDRAAIAAMVEHGSRLAGHRDRLSTRVRELRDMAQEAARLAAGEHADAVSARHVEAALQARRRRSDLVEQRIRQETLEGTLHIDVDGAVIGQLNGLAVAALGDYEFGHPVRITATVAPGEGQLVDIDREARLSGPVHAKGVLILSGYLAGRYFLDRPMTLRASIVFEQSYGPIEGDSASTAELLALLSALAGLPADQGIAVTGAVDQHGAVHAVGGINEKVEGFFDLCAARGLTGRQGVVIPEANLPHLMLDHRVVEAVRDDRFRVWPVRRVDESLSLITGAGDAEERVRDRLVALADAAQAAMGNGAM